MSASSDLQTAIAGLLRGYVVTVGTFDVSEYVITHNLGNEDVVAAVKHNGTNLLEGQGFLITARTANALTLQAPNGSPGENGWEVTVTELPAVVPIVARVSKKLENDILAAVANQGLAISIMPMMPEKVDEDVPFVFIERASIRVRIIEKVQTNKLPIDAYEMRDAVMMRLHYRPRDASDTVAAATLGAMLAYPLTLANPPAQMMFESGTERVIDVIFNAVLQINPD